MTDCMKICQKEPGCTKFEYGYRHWKHKICQTSNSPNSQIRSNVYSTMNNAAYEMSCGYGLGSSIF